MDENILKYLEDVRMACEDVELFRPVETVC